MTRRPAAGVAAAVALGALLAGCTHDTAPGLPQPTASEQRSPEELPQPEPSPETDGSPAPTGDEDATAPATSLTVRADVGGGVVTLDHESTSELATAAAVPDGDSGVVLTLTVPDATTAVTLEVPGAVGGTARRAADRSAAVVRADGGLALGVATPEATGADGSHPRTRWEEPDDAGPRLVLDLRAVDEAAFPLDVTSHLGSSVVRSTSWGEREGGLSLAVTPTDWGRVSGSTGRVFAWGDLLAQDPTADTPGMETQLQCHLIGAREKSTWNLEPWRPDLSLAEYALARCNPG